MTLSLYLSIISISVVIVNFILSILDRGKKAQKENHQELIEYQLKELKEELQKISAKLDKYDREVEDRIDKKIDLHVQLYHKGEDR